MIPFAPARRTLRHGALAAAALVALSAPAFAQSSVTVFGVLDVGVQQLTNGSKRVNLMSIDGLQTSRLGFRGTEDLGDGMSAGFHLEGALSPDTGGSSLDFRRRSTVSLAKKGVGELRLGRDYTPTFWSISRFNAFGTNGVGAASNLLYGFDGLSSSASTVVRANNSVGYHLPDTLGGVYGQAMFAFGEGSPGKYAGARIGYANKELDVAAAISSTENNAAGDNFKVANLGGSYRFGNARAMLLLHRSEQTTREQTGWSLGGTYTMGQTTLRASYTHANFSNSVGKVDYSGKQLALGTVYALSKRTSLYATISRVTNSGAAKYVIPGGSTVTAGQGSRGTEAGIYHSF
ncbi:porin [Aquabacterium sp. OR-4]|uniref:porin n=1 Tax=Aquabacterium sp. OR-4 TaxID=2978127 RepID=UPI0021B1DC81|nr:porin [Aquabacterium sp. OR-4]MDT7835419.1 porin [Aquabacterium sp. OR-4]